MEKGVCVFDRLIVLEHHEKQKIFFVPESLSLRQFMDNVKHQIVSIKHYNDEILSISRKLEEEQERIMSGNDNTMTARQGSELIHSFVTNHPLDERNAEDILTDSGAYELCKCIPPQNFIYN